ncbi:hypothetical protein I2W78_20465 [Streptomyces spinoverrucosus]|uniref:hypothetical protein n=1 Tax=Streptomyces spinoverrucosus TaxID=284043 RepID=UPI0018C355D6|nr:hypothetical protein [Streptomyces spinoverrucosus]MBG0854151.1 hypothetical protein [Streptomyces spinoverrucosus]
MKVPDRVRKFANVVLCLVAVAGIGWSGREIWQVWDGRRQIDEACAGLVPAGRVLALSPAGGTITHRQGEEGVIELDSLSSGQDCEIFSTEAGEKFGTDTGERWFFTGAVGALPADSPVVVDDPLEFLIDPFGRRTYPQQPLGNGIVGVLTRSGVVVQLPCAEGKMDGRPVGAALWARAELTETSRFGEDGQLTAHDRDILAETAVLTANNLAERLGCADRLPDPSRDIPALTEGPIPADRANGTCAWYRKAGFPRRENFADQVLESRVDDELWDESCGLILSDGLANGLYIAEADRHDTLTEPQNPGQWFVSLHTYRGEDAKNVHLKDPDFADTPAPATPGKAGRSSEEPIWWASSVCAGAPQIHTMTMAYGYDKLMAPEYEKVFRAYVTDVTGRRGCTDVKFPAPGTFRAD